ncbi:unnamed protein product [Prunus armeniaca]
MITNTHYSLAKGKGRKPNKQRNSVTKVQVQAYSNPITQNLKHYCLTFSNRHSRLETKKLYKMNKLKTSIITTHELSYFYINMAQKVLELKAHRRECLRTWS